MYEIKSLDAIVLSYRLQQLDGASYFTTYRLPVSASTEVKLASFRIGSLTSSVQLVAGFGETGVVRLVAVDQAADLALLNIPAYRKPFLTFDESSTAVPKTEVYSLALRPNFFGSKGWWRSLEVRWGELEKPCLLLKVGNDENVSSHLYSLFFLNCKPGNSGSPIVNRLGKVLAVASAMVLPSDDDDSNSEPFTFGVPADRAKEFYNAAIHEGVAPSIPTCLPCCGQP